MHYSQNQSYQQSPPNLRKNGQNGNGSKLGAIVDKNKQLKTMAVNSTKGGQGLFINNGPQGQNQLLLPMANGASGPQTTNAKTWNAQSMAHSMNQTQKNKDRYMVQQPRNGDGNGQGGKN